MPRGGPGIAKGAAQRFLAEALCTETDDCILWAFSKGGKGYAQINMHGKRLIVSRLVCKKAHGEPPSTKHHAAHSCGNGHLGCINKRHLRWALPTENEADKEGHGTLLHGEMAPWSKLSLEQVRAIRDRALSGENQSSLGREFGIGQQMVSMIKRGERWRRT